MSIQYEHYSQNEYVARKNIPIPQPLSIQTQKWSSQASPAVQRPDIPTITNFSPAVQMPEPSSSCKCKHENQHWQLIESLKDMSQNLVTCQRENWNLNNLLFQYKNEIQKLTDEIQRLTSDQQKIDVKPQNEELGKYEHQHWEMIEIIKDMSQNLVTCQRDNQNLNNLLLQYKNEIQRLTSTPNSDQWKTDLKLQNEELFQKDQTIKDLLLQIQNLKQNSFQDHQHELNFLSKENQELKEKLNYYMTQNVSNFQPDQYIRSPMVSDLQKENERLSNAAIRYLREIEELKSSQYQCINYQRGNRGSSYRSDKPYY